MGVRRKTDDEAVFLGKKDEEQSFYCERKSSNLGCVQKYISKGTLRNCFMAASRQK